MSHTVDKVRVTEIIGGHIAEALMVPADKIVPDARLLSDLQAESIDITDIRFRIEHEFKIKIDQQTMMDALGSGLTTDEFDARFTVSFITSYVTDLLAESDTNQ